MSIHNTKEWKQKADEFKRGKPCKWCGATKYLHVHHINGHYTNKHRILSVAYHQFKRVYNSRYPRKRKIDKTTGKTTYPRNEKAPDFKQEYAKWRKEQGIDMLIKEAHEKYLSLEDCMVLCRKCHYAAEHGRNLCPICKKKYKSTRYETCFDCLPATKKRDIVTHKENRRKYNERIEQCFYELDDDDWFYEFQNATPERKKEMLRQQDKELAQAYKQEDQVEQYKDYAKH